jgi:drug/metabolite transporter (DMT)-like permease
MDELAPVDGEAAPLRGYVIAFVGTALWSASAVFISHLNTRFGMPPLVLAFWRDLLVTGIIAGALALFSRPLLHLGRQNLPFFILYGFVLAIFNSLWTVSVALNGAAVATVLIYISPAFTALIGWRWFGERVTPLKIAAIGLSLIGCVFASGAHDRSVWQVNSLGIVVGLGTGLAFTVYSLLGKASSNKGVNPWTATLYTFAFGSAFLILAQRPDTILWLSRPLTHDPVGYREAALGWATILMLAIGPTLGGYGLYTVSLVHLPASTANLIVTLEPAMTAGLAFLFLGDRLAPLQLIGGLVILVAVFTLRLTKRRS